MENTLKTLMPSGFMIVTVNGEGVPYTITGEWMYEILANWYGDAEACPPNDAPVLLFAYDTKRVGVPHHYKIVSPTEYTDFESVMHWMQRHIAGRN